MSHIGPAMEHPHESQPGRASTHRTRVLSEVESIDPFDETEASHRDDVLRWIRSGAELCRLEKPATPPKHLVSYFVLVDEDALLLVDHRNAKLWLPTGGHVEAGEHPRTTVIREAKEELGLEAEFAVDGPVFVTCATTVGLTAGHTDVSLWYVLHGARRQSLDFDEDEFEEVRWFRFADVPRERTDPNLERFMLKLSAIRNKAASFV